MWLEGENGLIRLSHILSNDCTDTKFHQRLALPRKISNYSNQKKLWFRGLGSRLSRIASLQNINGSCRHTSITSSSHVFKLAAVPAAEHANPVFLALLVTAQTLVWYGMVWSLLRLLTTSGLGLLKCSSATAICLQGSAMLAATSKI